MLLEYLYSKRLFYDDYDDHPRDHGHGSGFRDCDDRVHGDHGDRDVSVFHANELRNNLCAYV